MPALKLKSALLFAFVALQVADVLTTNSFLAHASAVEGNPLMADAQASLGSWWWLAKLALVAGVTPILARGRHPLRCRDGGVLRLRRRQQRNALRKVSTMKKFLLAAAALALGVHSATAATDGWYKVTKAASACEAADTLSPCNSITLQVGYEVYYVREAQTVAGHVLLVHIECVSSPPASWLDTVTAKEWRDSFRPIKTPKRFYNADHCK